MKKFYNKYKLSILYVVSIIILSLLFTILEFIKIPFNISSIIIIILNFILTFIYAYINAKNSLLQGYKSGFRSGVKIWLMLLIINIITLNSFNFKLLLYYMIIMFISIIAGIISKNKNSSN